jgi:hypothetical protein
MTPQEKAKELIDTYIDIENYKNLNLDLFCDECGMNEQSAKYCAIIAVDEILKEIDNTTLSLVQTEYWQEVKTQIEKL